MRAADLEDVLAIEAASFPEPWSRATFEAELVNPDAVMQVFREDGRVLGQLIYRVVVDELELHNVAVLPAARGRGVGKALMQALLEDARGRRVTLEVREGNRAARALYESLGFKVIGRRPRYYANDDEAAVLYATGPR